MEFHSKQTTFVEHVKIKVENLERAIKFYRDILGFDILEQSALSVQLTADGKTSILSLEQPENVIPKQGKTTGLYHFAILLPEKKDLANIVIHLVENGIRFGSSDHLVSEALYFNDPDGNGIEIYVDRKPSEWTWNGEEVAMTVDPLNFENLIKYVTKSKWKGIPEKTIMGHIHLHVTELEKTEEFYVKGLGFDVVNRFGGQALFFSTGKYHHHIGVNVWNGVGASRPSKNSVGLEFFTLKFPNEEARKKTIDNLQKIGSPVIIENHIITTFDPSGNSIVLAV